MNIKVCDDVDILLFCKILGCQKDETNPSLYIKKEHDYTYIIVNVETRFVEQRGWNIAVKLWLENGTCMEFIPNQTINIFPRHCKNIDCPHFSYWDSSIDMFKCRCDILQKEVYEEKEHLSMDKCPINKKH